MDEALFLARPDLAQTGRTLMGHIAAKDQQLDDHYFGAIPSRVLEYMKDFELQAYRLGIPIKTRHNEVAPNQFECAPVFEEANIAVDHNTLLMTLMRRLAQKHKLRVLFHEKPFAGVNGSGKHCNWSLLTDTGINLLAPGKTPKNNIQFLTFFVNTIMAAHNYGLSQIERKQIKEETLAAPVKQGEKAGELQYFLNGKQIGSVDILTTEEVQRAGFVDYFQEGVDAFLL